MTRLGLFLLRLLHAALPLRLVGGLGEWLGRLLYRLAGSRRRVAGTNLRLCFPELSEAGREDLLKAHFRALGRAALLESVSWWGSREEIERLVRIEGLEHFQAHAGRPLILLAPHFLGLNIGGIRLSIEHAPLVSMYARVKEPTLDRVILNSRTRFGQSELVSRQDGIKPVLRAIKKGLPFYYLPDMDLGRRDAVFVPFFGVPAATVTGLPRLAKATGAAVLPAITRWTGEGYALRFYPAWEDYPSGDVEADTRRMNAFIEARIREMPEQYFWPHRRFKTRPEGEASLYG